MKTNMTRLVLACLVSATLWTAACAGDVSEENDSIEKTSAALTTSTTVGTSIADWMIAKYPNIETLTAKSSWEYTNGMILSGFVKLYAKTKNPSYIKYVQTWVDRYVSSAGVINRTSTFSQDATQPAALLPALYAFTGAAKYKTAATSQRNLYPSFPKNSEGAFYHKANYPNQQWLDGLWMGEPFLALYGKTWATTGSDQSFCYNTAATQLKIIKAANASTNLLRHAHDPSLAAAWADPTTKNSPCFWGRAMGWYAMALVDVLDSLPATHADYQNILTIYKSVVVGLKATQDSSTGLWWQVLDQPTGSGNYLETSASAMFVYAIKKGVDKGYIDSATYLPVATKGWTGVKSKITFGAGTPPSTVTVAGAVAGMGVQTSFANYVAIKATNNAPHGFAGVLAAASVME